MSRTQTDRPYLDAMPEPTHRRAAWRSLVPFTLALTACGWAQTVKGTMTTTLPPSGKTVQQEYDRRVFELRRGGMTENQIQASDEMIRHSAERLAAGLGSTGPFEYVRDGVNTWVTYPVSSTSLGSDQSQHIESYDGTTTVHVGPSGTVVEAGDKRTFTGNALWQAALCGTVQSWLQEVSATQGPDGEVVVFEAVKDEMIHRLTVTYADSARARVVAVDQGYVTPAQFVKPGVDPYVRAAKATVQQSPAQVDFDFFAGGKATQHITLAIESESPDASVALLRGVKPGSKVVDLRLGAKAPVNYVFDGKLPEHSAIASEPAPVGLAPLGASFAGLVGLVAAVWLWKRK
ncbi:MAG: hypothetical protein IT207_03065 [Fimbriimonadaceae bacterium]|nr:hypothetical protein [Fimbriimonadaceae bacterium]